MLIGRIIKKILGGGNADNGSQKNLSHVDSHQYQDYSPEKQAKLNQLCEQLFAQREAIPAGRLQFLGLSKIKRTMGKQWPGLQKIVYHEVEDAIKKYLYSADLFMRYKDDNYMIIFAEASPEEAQIKMRLIAEDIQRRLFARPEPALKEIEIKQSIAIIQADEVPNTDALMDKLNHFDGIIERDKADFLKTPDHQRETPPQPQPAPKKQTPKNNKPSTTPIDMSDMDVFEVSPYDDKSPTEQPSQPHRDDPFHLTYIPLWDAQRNLLTTYLSLATPFFEKEHDAFDAHEHIFEGLTQSQTTAIDHHILDLVRHELEIANDHSRKISIACPVNYSTLSHGDSFNKFLMQCQNIAPELKRRLIFIVLNIPGDLPITTIKKFSLPIKNHCTGLYAHVPLNPKLNFSGFRDCGFDALGVRLKHETGNEKEIIEKLEDFTTNTKNALIGKVFVLDIKSFSVTTSAVCSNVDLLGGSMIHDNVLHPDHIYKFAHQDLFANMQKKQDN